MKCAFLRTKTVCDEVIPPLHFGYLAAKLSARHEVHIIDALCHNLEQRQVEKMLEALAPEILGFSAFTKDLYQTKIVMQRLRSILPKTKFVLGGVQMSVMPQETFSYLMDFIDYGFAGESELGFSHFVENMPDIENDENSLAAVPNLVWQQKGVIRENKRELVTDLDQLPFPRWKLMVPTNYPKAPHGAFYRQYPYAPLITSRGCPYPCSFCSAGAVSGKKIRYRSLENVLDEINYLHQHFGVKEIHIEDDNFSMQEERVVAFSEMLLRKKMGTTWAFPNGLRLDNLSFDTLKLMQRAGCYAVNVGVESGCEERLKAIHKGTTREKLRTNISRVKSAGIDIGGFFIIGFPGETVEEIKESKDFALSLELDRIGISYFQPYPGCSEYDKLVAKGEYIFDPDASRHSLHTITYLPQGISAKQLKNLRFSFFLSFYCRFKIVLKLFREVRSFEQFKFILKRGLRWLTT